MDEITVMMLLPLLPCQAGDIRENREITRGPSFICSQIPRIKQVCSVTHDRLQAKGEATVPPLEPRFSHGVLRGVQTVAVTHAHSTQAHARCQKRSEVVKVVLKVPRSPLYWQSIAKILAMYWQTNLN